MYGLTSLCVSFCVFVSTRLGHVGQPCSCLGGYVYKHYFLHAGAHAHIHAHARIHAWELKTSPVLLAMSKLSAQQLQEKYGDMLAGPPWSDLKSAYLLQRALQRRRPAVPVSVAAVKTWIGKYRIASGGYSINTAEELQDQYGSSILPLAREHPTEYKLTNALLKRDPPIVITDAVAHVWLKMYGPHGPRVNIDNAGHLEIWRAHSGAHRGQEYGG